MITNRGLIIRNASGYAPEPFGPLDIYIYGGRILAIAADIDKVPGTTVDEIDASRCLVLPGFVDPHIHISGGGGGGAGGPATREPSFDFGEIVRTGVTALVGCCGSDYLSRSLHDLLQMTRSLSAHGIESKLWTNGYSRPPRTLTGSIANDLLVCSEVVGAKIAISDFRAPRWTADELAAIMWELITGSYIAAKPGILHVHSGKLPSRLRVLRDLIDLYRTGQSSSNKDEPELSIDTVVGRIQVTHVNWLESLLDDAIEFAMSGGIIDVTCGISPAEGFEGSVAPSKAVKAALDRGVKPEHITVSSDAGGNATITSEDGSVEDVLRMRSPGLHGVFKALISEEQIDGSDAVRMTSTNAASLLGFHNHGRIEAGGAGNLVLLKSSDLEIERVVLRGEPVVTNGELSALSLLEQHSV